MRKAWFKDLQLLVLIFLFISVFSFKSLSSEVGETEAASLQLALTLTPAEAVVPGDRITRQILLKNLTDKKLKYSVEGIHCTGTAALLPYLTLQLMFGEQTLFFERADQLGTMSSFPISIPAACGNGHAGGAVRDEAAGEVRVAEHVVSAEAVEAETVLTLLLDFSPAAEASLMGSEARIQLLLSAEEALADGETEMPETQVPETDADKLPSVSDDAETKQGQAESTGIEGVMKVEMESDAAGNFRTEDSGAEQRKESAAAEGSAGKSSRGVLFGGAVSFLGGPGTERVLELAEDPPMSTEDLQQTENQKRGSAGQKTEGSDTEAVDSRLSALLERLRQRQKNTMATEGKSTAPDSRDLSILVEEQGGQGLCIQKAQSIYGGEAVTIYLGEANMKGSARRIFGALGNLLLWLMIFIAIYFALSAYQERRTGKPFFFMGYKPVLILSESMEPTYPKGAIVLVRKQKRAAEPGDVVMFSPEAGSGTYVIHRIVEESEEGFITRGDHNNTEDRGIVVPEQIYGTVKGLIWA